VRKLDKGIYGGEFEDMYENLEYYLDNVPVATIHRFSICEPRRNRAAILR
jgi:hypothetical protein